MDIKKFQKFMYYLVKDATRESFVDWLEERDLTEDDYEEIKKELEEHYKIKMYL